MGELAPLLTAVGTILGLLTVAFGFFLSGARADRKELATERAALARAEQELEKERKLRRAAEDREAKLAREVARLGEKVDDLTTEVAALRDQLGRQL